MWVKNLVTVSIINKIDFFFQVWSWFNKINLGKLLLGVVIILYSQTKNTADISNTVRKQLLSIPAYFVFYYLLWKLSIFAIVLFQYKMLFRKINLYIIQLASFTSQNYSHYIVVRENISLRVWIRLSYERYKYNPTSRGGAAIAFAEDSYSRLNILFPWFYFTLCFPVAKGNKLISKPILVF